MSQHVLNAYPAFRIVLPFIGGTIAGAFTLEQVALTADELLLLLGIWAMAVLALAILTFTARFPKVFGAMMITVAFAGGFLLLCSVSDHLRVNHLVFQPKGEQTYLMTIVEEPVNKARSLKVEADAVSQDGKHWGRVLLYMSSDSATSRLNYGDKLLVQATLQTVRPNGNPNEFNYPRFLRFHHIYHQAFVPAGHWQLIARDGGSVMRWFIEMRQKLLAVFRKAGLEGNEYAVAAALVLGYKADLEQSLVQAYTGAGATHVLAVSGLHVGIIYLVLDALLSFLLLFKHGATMRAGCNVLLLICYAAITGLSPSVCRAVTMFSFVAIARTAKRKLDIYNTLACSALALVLYDPLIVMQVGFQLSYAAVLGIVVFQPWFYGLYTPKNRLQDKVWEITCVSIAAQLSTFPLGLLYFHQFPNLFFISNLFVIPGATLVLGLGLFAFVAQVYTPLLEVVGMLLHGVIKGMNKVVSWIDEIPHAVASGIDITVMETLMIYAVIACLTLLIVHRKVQMLLPAAVLCLALVVSQTVEYAHQSQQHELTIYNIRNETAIAMIDGTELQFLASTTLANDTQSMLFNVRHHWWAMGAGAADHKELNDSLLNRPFHWCGNNCVILGKLPPDHVYHISDSIKVAIVHGLTWSEIPDVAAQMPGMVVLSSALGTRTKEYLIGLLAPGTEVWDVSTQGVFKL